MLVIKLKDQLLQCENIGVVDDVIDFNRYKNNYSGSAFLNRNVKITKDAMAYIINNYVISKKHYRIAADINHIYTYGLGPIYSILDENNQVLLDSIQTLEYMKLLVEL